MRTLQDKFFDILDLKAEEAGFELVVSYNFANTGSLYLQNRADLKTYLRLPFDFQPRRVALGWHLNRDAKNPGEAVQVFPGRPNPYFALFEAGAMDEAIAAILDTACGAKLEQRRAEEAQESRA